MATEQSKSPEQAPPPPTAPVIAYPPPYGAAHYAPMPPGPYGQPIYTFAPMPADPNHDPNVPNGAPQPGPYLVALPPHPGFMYAYAPPHAGQRMSADDRGIFREFSPIFSVHVSALRRTPYFTGEG